MDYGPNPGRGDRKSLDRRWSRRRDVFGEGEGRRGAKHTLSKNLSEVRSKSTMAEGGGYRSKVFKGEGFDKRSDRGNLKIDYLLGPGGGGGASKGEFSVPYSG